MASPAERAESFRDLSKILATIGSGLFIAAGIGASFFRSSIDTALQLNNQGYEIILENSTTVAASNTTEILKEGALASLESASYSVNLMQFLLGEGVILSVFAIHFWNESHKILTKGKDEVSLKLSGIIFAVCLLIILFGSFL